MNMYAVVGTLFLALAVLGFAVMLLISRRPNPPAWIQSTLAQEIIAISTVSLVGFGFGFAFQSFELLGKQPPTTTQLILIALIVIGFLIAWMRLKVRATLANYERQASGVETAAVTAAQPGLVVDFGEASPTPGASAPEGPGSPTRPRTPRWPKKAA